MRWISSLPKPRIAGISSWRSCSTKCPRSSPLHRPPGGALEAQLRSLQRRLSGIDYRIGADLRGVAQAVLEKKHLSAPRRRCTRGERARLRAGLRHLPQQRRYRPVLTDRGYDGSASADHPPPAGQLEPGRDVQPRDLRRGRDGDARPSTRPPPPASVGITSSSSLTLLRALAALRARSCAAGRG